MHTTIATLPVLSQASDQVNVVSHVPSIPCISILLTSVATASMLVFWDLLDLATCDTESDSVVHTLQVPILIRINHRPL